ncbi:ATP-binding protein [Halostreptopolyspora alba]|uniref:ATP-binding protein n=1 Tax=Halostreptopolyspora alba TaxID=2487137 RepID=A0A3N0E961_9ACTN|nr:ATP-binding protein [Nocardiopsaceae bacterium YIM 96095]
MSAHINQVARTETAHCRWFPGATTELRRLRTFVANHLDGCPQTPEAVLLADELATNVLEHTPSHHWSIGFLVSIWHIPDRQVRITVRDAGATMTAPHVTTPHLDAEHGRGLILVDTLATRWGTCTSWFGRETWFHLHCD